MRRLIRSIETKEYFCRGEWTSDARSAQDFPDTLSAIEAALQAQLCGVEMVLQIGPEPSAAYDICLPLQLLAADLLPRAGTANSSEPRLTAVDDPAPSQPAFDPDPADPPAASSSGTDPETPEASS